jgi:hypothetical protein
VRLTDAGSGYPAFVEKDFSRYLNCGLLANGFARLRCPSCGYERFVAFSCKGCLGPSCRARRMAVTAALHQAVQLALLSFNALAGKAGTAFPSMAVTRNTEKTWPWRRPCGRTRPSPPPR